MIDVRNEGAVAVLTMTHGKANALDVEFCTALADRFDALRGEAAKAVILTAEGKIFSAGVDLKRLSDEGPVYVRRFLPALHRLYEAVFFHPKPVVAALNGHAIAGGCVLAACADRRVMAQGTARVGTTELLVGVPLPALAFEVVRSVVPERFLPEVSASPITWPRRCGSSGQRANAPRSQNHTPYCYRRPNKRSATIRACSSPSPGAAWHSARRRGWRVAAA